MSKEKQNTELSTDKTLHIADVSCCALLDELQLKLIGISCFAQEHFNEKAFNVTEMNINEIMSWVKKKRSELAPNGPATRSTERSAVLSGSLCYLPERSKSLRGESNRPVCSRQVEPDYSLGERVARVEPPP